MTDWTWRQLVALEPSLAALELEALAGYGSEAGWA